MYEEYLQHHMDFIIWILNVTEFENRHQAYSQE